MFAISILNSLIFSMLHIKLFTNERKADKNFFPECPIIRCFKEYSFGS